MKKLVLSLAVISALGLSACDSESLEDAQNDAIENDTGISIAARVKFDPSNGALSVPNDLLLLGTTDGTLNVPTESDEDGNHLLAPDYFDPSTAIGALDGWSTINPFAIDIIFPEGNSLNGDTVFNPASVRIFKAVMGGDTSDAACESLSRGLACKIVSELAYTTDFITQKSGDSVAVVPLKPLEPKTTYLLVMTDSLQDMNGDAIKPSSTYELVKQDITTAPLGSESQLALQGVINSFENAAESAGVDKASIIYSMAMTTQSIADVSETVKLLMLSGQMGTTPVIGDVTYNMYTAATALGIPEAAGLPYVVANSAEVHSTTLTMPYYLETPFYDGSAASCNLLAEDITAGCPDLFSYWQAMGDSPATVLGALQSGVLSQASFAEQAIAQGQDPADLLANPSKLVGLNFTIEVAEGVSVNLDQQRHLTQYNPLPQVRSYPTIDATVTMPNVDYINAVRAMQKGAALTEAEMLTKPAAGWPVMIYSHGITAYKESVFAIAGTLANAGIATIAIDHPYHGSRGIDFNGDGVYEISATQSLKGVHPAYANADVTSYMNLASLLTARDNVRQSEVDLLALRLGLTNAFFNNDMPGHLYGVLDATNVSFLGHSLGGITGAAMLAVANSGVVNPATGELSPVNPYEIKSASLAMPGGGIPGILINSPSFGPVVQAGLTSSSTFMELVKAQAEADGLVYEELTEEQIAAYTAAIYPGFASQFNFAGQTIVDAADPINYAATVNALNTPVHAIEIVGDEALGGSNKSDQVIPNFVATLPLVGTEPLVANLGLASASETTGDGTSVVKVALRFLKGHHSSVLDPAPIEGVTDGAEVTGAVTSEIQKQIASFAASGGKYLEVTDSSYIVPVSGE